MMRTLIIVPPMTEAEAAEWVTSQELAAAREFGSERRRREYLTWRAVVRRELERESGVGRGRGAGGVSNSELACESGSVSGGVSAGDGVRIGYNEVGAPVIAGGGIYIGVAHCPDRVAVCLSDGPCAVDIEPVSRDFSRAAGRYLSPQEQALSDDPLWPGIVWCAKETLYKYAGQPGVDWLRDLCVESVDFSAGTITGRVGDDDPIGLSFCCREGFIVVYIL